MRTDTNHTIAILADDLTSAADGAAPFVARGRAAFVGRQTLPNHDSAVLSVDSGSRSLAGAASAARVADLTSKLSHRSILFKTVDSTLRGHVKTELEACFAASGRHTLVFAPAFPAAGRTTVGGVQLVDGVPVSESVFGQDPVHAARCSTLVDLVPRCIQNVVLINATSQAALDHQVAALPEPASLLWVGSPGLASALASRFVTAANPASPLGVVGGDVLVVLGSANPRSHRQADRVELASGVTLLRSPQQREPHPAAVLNRIAQAAAQALRDGRFDALMATGGDTMEAILDRLNVREFQILGELDPGFPLGRAVLDDGRALMLAMKAGGFGDDDVLRRGVAKLRGVCAFEQRPSA